MSENALEPFGFHAYGQCRMCIFTGCSLHIKRGHHE